MSLRNATVILTYKLEGSIASPGSYDYRERTTSGSVLPESQRLFIVREPKNSDCYQRVHLCEAFVNWAISDDGRPGKKGGFKDFKAHTFWRRMGELQRLTYHVIKYAHDMGATEYTFEINEE